MKIAASIPPAVVLRLIAFGAMVSTAGCVQVAPVPADIAARVAARTSATLDLTDLHARAAALAPGEAPLQTGAQLDRLTVFAAILAVDPRVTAARATVEAARRDARLARKAAMPALSLTTDYTNDPGQPTAWQLGASGNVQLDFGSRKQGRLRSADLAIVSASYDLVEMVWAERTAAARGLVDLFAGEQQARLGAEVVRAFDRQLVAMQHRVDAGEIAGLAMAQVRAQRAAAARALDDAIARSRAGRAALAGVLGVPVTALDPVMVNWPDFATVPGAPAITPEMIRAALIHRGDVLKTIVAYDQAEAALRIEVAKQVPALALSPGFTWNGGLVNIPLGVNLQMPSFDGNRTAIAASEAHRAAAGKAIESTLADAQTAIETAVSERTAAGAAYIRLLHQELPQAQRLADKGDVQLRLGAINRADWAALKSTEASARLAAVDALTRVRLAQIALEAALRRPLDGPETLITVRTDPGLGVRPTGERQP